MTPNNYAPMFGKWRVSDAHGLCLVLSPDGTSQTDATLVLDATSPEVDRAVWPTREQLVVLCDRLNTAERLRREVADLRADLEGWGEG